MPVVAVWRQPDPGPRSWAPASQPDLAILPSDSGGLPTGPLWINKIHFLSILTESERDGVKGKKDRIHTYNIFLDTEIQKKMKREKRARKEKVSITKP